MIRPPATNTKIKTFFKPYFSLGGVLQILATSQKQTMMCLGF